ncbi:ROK family protein [Isoptericola sp. NPDC057559]|uniref:ROK family protein n=1 Tax=Isoptericola sp. NPDC057559 TaxID=3346168 RepID=UPI0036B131D4
MGRDHGAPDGARDVVAGLDIGGTGTSVVLLDGERVVAREHAPTPARDGGAAMAATAAGLVRSALGATPGARLVGAGVGAAGVVDAASGTVVAASDSFRDWAGFPLGAELGAALGVPVRVENDVNAFALGESRLGAARGLDDVLAVTLGTGVGGAFVLGGELYRGPRGAAGEIGHVRGFGDLPCTCGGRGHLETLASGRAVARAYQRAAGTAVAGAREVADLARAGDPHARDAFAAAADAVGRAAVLVASLLDVTDVVVGGGVAAAWDLLGPGVAESVLREPPVSGAAVRARPSSLGRDAVALGAASLAPAAALSLPG